MKKQTKNLVLNTLFSIAVFLIGLILITNIITVIGWIININITAFHLPLAIIITFILNFFLQKKMHQMTGKQYIFTILGSLMVIAIALIIANIFFDISYDGGWYHLNAIIKMKEGWNPLYELINTGSHLDVYNDSYACKSFWAFGATVYALFGNINSAKIISTLLAFAVSFFGVSIFGKLAKTKIQWILLVIGAFLIGFNPIYLSQMYTNYLDSTVGLLSLFYILLFIARDLKQMDFKDLDFKVLIIASIALMATTKFTGLFFAAIFFILFVFKEGILSIIKKDGKTFKRLFFTGLAGVILALFLGLNPYITNIARGHHVFYPIMGDEQIEVMGINVPTLLKDKSTIEKLLIANFSKTANGIDLTATKLKSPLSITKEEYGFINQDTRIGAFGSAFALILTLSGIAVIIYSKQLLTKEKKEEEQNTKYAFSKSCIVILLVALIFGESWWGRYYVPLYIIPILIAIYLTLQPSKIKKGFSILIIGIALLNSMMITYSITKYNLLFSKSMTDYLESIKGQTILFNCFDPIDHKWELAYQKYFEEYNITSTPTYDDIDYDFIGGKVAIKVIK